MPAEPRALWRVVVDRAKHSRAMLRLADMLGRGTGRYRVLDRLGRVQAAPLTPDLSDFARRHLSAVWLGHATVLLRIGGATVLTDPVFSRRVGVGLGLVTGGPRRLTSLPLPPERLPKPDIVLLSHAHFDHLDLPTLATLPRDVRVVLPTGCRDLVAPLGFERVTELATGGSAEVGGVRVTAVPVAHWGARVFFDTFRGYHAYLIEASDAVGGRVLFGGDSAFQRQWRGLGPVDLCCVGIGAYDPWEAAHATPEQAMTMADDCAARFVLPMHHSTFKLSHEPLAEPIERFKRVCPPGRLALDAIGGEWTTGPG